VLDAFFDSTGLSRGSPVRPNESHLLEKGTKVFRYGYVGEPYKFVLNPRDGCIEPAITISRTPNNYWITSAEVAIGPWLHGDRLARAEIKAIPDFLAKMSRFVEDMTAAPFDAFHARVCRLDVAIDLMMHEADIPSFVDARRKLVLAKYNRNLINDTTLSFDVKGKERNQRKHIYGRQQKMRDKKETPEIIKAAAGILRAEAQYKNNRAVTDLAKSLKLPNHDALTILTQSTADIVIAKVLKLFQLDSALQGKRVSVEDFYTAYGPAVASRLVNHLHLKRQFGTEYYNFPVLKTTRSAFKRYDKMCAQVGLLSLE
jgi:hypothetical protein